MKRTVPGWLYAKSLEAGGAMGGGYRTWFRNAELASHEGSLMQLRSQFHWVPDSGRRHPPVVVVEPGTEGGKALLVRFSDAGADSFGRPQTLRMEAMLVAEADVASCWDGAFKAEPNAGNACFLLDLPETAEMLPSFGKRRLVIGDPATFALGNVPRPADAGSGGRGGGETQERTTPPAPPPTPTPRAAPATAGRKKRSWPFSLAIAALLAAVAGNIVQYRTSAAMENKMALQRKRLESLSARERQLPEKERQLAEREQLQAEKEGDFQERLEQLRAPVRQIYNLSAVLLSITENQPKGDEANPPDSGTGNPGGPAESEDESVGLEDESSPAADVREDGGSGFYEKACQEVFV